MIPAPFHLYRLELSLASAMTSSSLQARSGIHVHIRMIMINILYTFLVICFPDVMPSLAALTGGTQYLPQNINGMNILPLFYGKQIDTDDRVLFIGNSQVSSVLRATVTGRLLPSSQTSLWNSIICVKTQKRNMISPRSIRKW